MYPFPLSAVPPPLALPATFNKHIHQQLPTLAMSAARWLGRASMPECCLPRTPGCKRMREVRDFESSNPACATSCSQSACLADEVQTYKQNKHTEHPLHPALTLSHSNFLIPISATHNIDTGLSSSLMSGLTALLGRSIQAHLPLASSVHC